MYYIGLDVHKKTISYCVKDAAGKIYSDGKIGSTRRRSLMLQWSRLFPQPRMMAMEATIFTGWIYDHLVPHAEKVNQVAHPLMLRAIAAAKRKNDKIDASKIADCLRCRFSSRVLHDVDGDPRPATHTSGYRGLLVNPQMVQMKNRISGLLMETGVSYNKQAAQDGLLLELMAGNEAATVHTVVLHPAELVSWLRRLIERRSWTMRW